MEKESFMRVNFSPFHMMAMTQLNCQQSHTDLLQLQMVEEKNERRQQKY